MIRVSKPRRLGWQLSEVSESTAVTPPATDLEFLRRRDLLLSGILENSSLLIGVKDLNGRYLLHNRAFAAAVCDGAQGNCTPEDLAGFGDCWLAAEQRSAVRELDARAEHETFRAEETFDLPGGGRVTWDVLRFALKDTSGQVWATCQIARDISAEAELRHELRDRAGSLAAAQERLRLVTENITDVVTLTDLRGTITWVSPSVLPAMGYQPHELVGTTTQSLVHPDDLPMVFAVRSAADRDQGQLGLTLRGRTASGEYRWISLTSGPVLDSAGSELGRVTAMRDVEEEVTTRNALAELDRRYRLVALNATDMVVMVDLAGVFTWVSPATRQVLGYHPAELIGTDGAHLIHPDDTAMVQDMRDRIAHGEEAISYELRLLNRAGDYVWLAATAGPVLDGDGNLVGRLITQRDIHEQVLTRQALADSENRYRMLAQSATDLVWQLDPSGVLVWTSASTDRLMGAKPDDLTGNPAIDLVHPEDRPAWSAWRRRHTHHDDDSDAVEVRLRTAGSEYRWMSAQSRRISGGPNAGPQGGPGGAVIGFRDVQEQVEAREALDRSERVLRLAMDFAPLGIAVVSLHGLFLRVNLSVRELTGRDEAWMLGHGPADLFDADFMELELSARDRLLAGESEVEVQECQLLAADGSQVWVEKSLALARDPHEMPLFFVVSYRDIARAHAAQQDLRFRAEHDTLTGLINRAELHERLRDLLTRGGGGLVALLFVDVDRFKVINDSFGHAAGDHVLRTIAERIQSALGDADEAARLGGDEFVIVQPDVHDVGAAVAVAHRVRAAVAHPIHIGRDERVVTVSIGVAVGSSGIETRELLNNADVALYRAKTDGRDQVAAFDSERPTAPAASVDTTGRGRQSETCS